MPPALARITAGGAQQAWAQAPGAQTCLGRRAWPYERRWRPWGDKGLAKVSQSDEEQSLFGKCAPAGLLGRGLVLLLRLFGSSVGSRLGSLALVPLGRRLVRLGRSCRTIIRNDVSLVALSLGRLDLVTSKNNRSLLERRLLNLPLHLLLGRCLGRDRDNRRLGPLPDARLARDGRRRRRGSAGGAHLALESGHALLERASRLDGRLSVRGREGSVAGRAGSRCWRGGRSGRRSGGLAEFCGRRLGRTGRGSSSGRGGVARSSSGLVLPRPAS